MCEDVRKGFVEHLELFDIGVVVTNGMEILAFPCCVGKGACVCTAHKAYIGVMKTYFV